MKPRSSNEKISSPKMCCNHTGFVCCNQPDVKCCPSSAKYWLQPKTASSVLPVNSASKIASVEGPGQAGAAPPDTDVAAGKGTSHLPTSPDTTSSQYAYLECIPPPAGSCGMVYLLRQHYTKLSPKHMKRLNMHCLQAILLQRTLDKGP